MVGHGDHGLEVSGESFPKGQVFGVLVFLIPVWNQKWNWLSGNSYRWSPRAEREISLSCIAGAE